MRTHVALLRGIDVGGHDSMATADPRGIATALGCSEVATHVRSGNLVLGCSETDTTRLAVVLERAIADRTEVRPAVVVLSRDELQAVVADNPDPQETAPDAGTWASTANRSDPTRPPPWPRPRSGNGREEASGPTVPVPHRPGWAA